MNEGERKEGEKEEGERKEGEKKGGVGKERGGGGLRCSDREQHIHRRPS